MVVHMTREPNIDVVNPTIAEIHHMMQQVSQDDDDPLIVLKAPPTGESTTNSNELWITRLNSCETSSFVGWLVRHKVSAKKTSVVLATAKPNQEAFQRYEMFGALEDIRPECLAPQTVIDEAIQWFLATGDENPSSTWLDFSDSVRMV